MAPRAFRLLSSVSAKRREEARRGIPGSAAREEEGGGERETALEVGTLLPGLDSYTERLGGVLGGAGWKRRLLLLSRAVSC